MNVSQKLPPSFTDSDLFGQPAGPMKALAGFLLPEDCSSLRVVSRHIKAAVDENPPSSYKKAFESNYGVLGEQISFFIDDVPQQDYSETFYKLLYYFVRNHIELPFFKMIKESAELEVLNFFKKVVDLGLKKLFVRMIQEIFVKHATLRGEERKAFEQKILKIILPQPQEGFFSDERFFVLMGIAAADLIEILEACLQLIPAADPNRTEILKDLISIAAASGSLKSLRLLLFYYSRVPEAEEDVWDEEDRDLKEILLCSAFFSNNLAVIQTMLEFFRTREDLENNRPLIEKFLDYMIRDSIFNKMISTVSLSTLEFFVNQLSPEKKIDFFNRLITRENTAGAGKEDRIIFEFSEEYFNYLLSCLDKEQKRRLLISEWFLKTIAFSGNLELMKRVTEGIQYLEGFSVREIWKPHLPSLVESGNLEGLKFVWNGTEEEVKRQDILTGDPSPRSDLRSGYHLFHYATLCRKNTKEMFNFLMDQFKEKPEELAPALHKKNVFNICPLNLAAMDQNLAAITIILAQEKDPIGALQQGSGMRLEGPFQGMMGSSNDSYDNRTKKVVEYYNKLSIIVDLLKEYTSEQRRDLLTTPYSFLDDLRKVIGRNRDGSLIIRHASEINTLAYLIKLQERVHTGRAINLEAVSEAKEKEMLKKIERCIAEIKKLERVRARSFFTHPPSALVLANGGSAGAAGGAGNPLDIPQEP